MARQREALDALVRLGLGIAHEFQQRLGGAGIAQPQRGRMEAADGLITVYYARQEDGCTCLCSTRWAVG